MRVICETLYVTQGAKTGQDLPVEELSCFAAAGWWSALAVAATAGPHHSLCVLLIAAWEISLANGRCAPPRCMQPPSGHNGRATAKQSKVKLFYSAPESWPESWPT